MLRLAPTRSSPTYQALLPPPPGEDGPSQMALEDFAMFRAIPDCVCFYPSDAVSAERAFELAANYRGMTFTRTSRPGTAVVYKNDEVFEIGKGKVGLREGRGRGVERREGRARDYFIPVHLPLLGHPSV